MNCPVCGQERRNPNARFCSGCGTSFVAQAAATPQFPVVSPYPLINQQNEKIKAQARNKRLISSVIFWSIALPLIAFVGTIGYFAYTEKAFDLIPLINDHANEVLPNTGGTVLLVIIVDSLVLWPALSMKCPTCGSYRGGIEDTEKKVELGRRTGYRTVSETSDIHGKDGEVIGTTEIKRQVRVRTTTYQLHYHCRYCGAQWTKEKEEQTENFDD